MVRSLPTALGKDAEKLLASAQAAINLGQATLYEAKISQGIRKVGQASKISHFTEAALTYKRQSSEGAARCVHPALLQAALAISEVGREKVDKQSDVVKPADEKPAEDKPAEDK